MAAPDPDPIAVRMPEAPVLVAGVGGAAWISADGEVESLTLAEAARRVEAGAVPVVCHAPAIARRLGTPRFAALDVLELFAFAQPARFCVPTPRGLARVLGLALPDNLGDEAAALLGAARALLSRLGQDEPPPGADALPIAIAMARGGWPWGKAVVAAPGGFLDAPHSANLLDGLKVWNKLPHWNDSGPEPPPDNQPVEPVEARAKLVQLLGADAEERPEQADYAAQVSAAFLPRDRAGEPRLVLAEAGTGVGKTLGYLAPASVWAEKNKGPVWISTYTRNLQRQLDAELDRLYPERAEKEQKVVVRKGRENYLCLLNFDEAVGRIPTGGAADVIGLGLMARWAGVSRDGDMAGGDFPGWLTDLLGRAATLELTDTRGECVYSACGHYAKCFIERTVRRARRAEIVVGNHALIMAQAALGGGDEAAQAFLPSRYVFDEGHHLFDAADGAFSAHFSGREAEELRRWLLGAESRSRSRSRGLKARIEDLVAGTAEAAEALAEVLRAARSLPGSGWHQRLAGGTPVGPAEAFLALVRQQVYARDRDGGNAYSLETETRPPVPGLLDAAAALESALARLGAPVTVLVQALMAFLDDEADTLDTGQRLRLEAVCRGLERRGGLIVQAWRSMLRSLGSETPDDFVDWFSVERIDGRDLDVGFHRHWIDPTQPFAETMAGPAQGLLVTSASLRDGSGDEEADWAVAERRSGARHMAAPAVLARVPSPFDYAAQTRVLIVTDVARNNADQVAAAYRELFLAAGGGGLGLFTAITRLRAVHERIAQPLDQAGLTLLAQHVDALDTGSLIDIFRAEDDACLLGTDAVRDGVDVPGRALRLIVFERVPWPRPDILHRARRDAFGGRAHDEMLTRLRIKQAYGRLIRRATDRGVFVMLDRAMPSRLGGAFPEGVAPRRLGLAETLTEVRAFLSDGAG
ncbi:MAG: ATP-dependent DNA helicase [Rhodospirillales bacterium]|jgi:ATP-dependent DNA helicase DinG|nr:ATP-dependent DNA helicase [Rhodospirillales bacterium]